MVSLPLRAAYLAFGEPITKTWDAFEARSRPKKLGRHLKKEERPLRSKSGGALLGEWGVVKADHMQECLQVPQGTRLATLRGLVRVRKTFGHGRRGECDNQGHGDQNLLHGSSPMRPWGVRKLRAGGQVVRSEQLEDRDRHPACPIPVRYRMRASAARNSGRLSSPKPPGISICACLRRCSLYRPGRFIFGRHHSPRELDEYV